MHFSDLFIQVFMAASLISGVAMLVFTIGFLHELRRSEVWGRGVLAVLIIYSVLVRWYLSTPGEDHIDPRWFYPGFDILYLALCLFFIINVLLRGSGDGYGKRRR